MNCPKLEERVSCIGVVSATCERPEHVAKSTVNQDKFTAPEPGNKYPTLILLLPAMQGLLLANLNRKHRVPQPADGIHTASLLEQKLG